MKKAAVDVTQGPATAGDKQVHTAVKPPGAPISPDRRAELIEKAARLFGAHGYNKTSMRDISAAFGILHGSIYHHFGSKDELFIAVYSAGVDRFIAEVEKAVVDHGDPWQRLEAACVAHLEALLSRESPAATVLADWSSTYSEPLRQALVAQRDRYEKVFSRLTDAVELPEGVKRRYFRLGLLGALNGALMWYQPGGDSPATVAKHLVGLFRRKVTA